MLQVSKTLKLFIGGKFPRTESGRSFPIYFKESQQVYANVCQGSRKDLRNAVQIAKSALPGWSNQTAFLRSQILYRMAEMLESKRIEVKTAIESVLGYSSDQADVNVEEGIAALLYYAGFADKYAQVMGSMNPVSGPFHNFTIPEPVGVVGLIYDEDEFSLGKFMAELSAIICSGNTTVVLLNANASCVLAPLAEAFATSDLPGGVINLISCHIEELLGHMARHMEVNSVTCLGVEEKKVFELKQQAVENMKRIVPTQNEQLSLDNITKFTEYKTIWHTVGV